MKLFFRVALGVFLTFGLPVQSKADIVRVSSSQNADGTSDAAIARHAADILRGNDRLTLEQAKDLARKRAETIERLRKDLAPAPLIKDENGLYFHGTIIDYMPGLRTGDPADPANHDRFLFSAFGPEGKNKSKSPALVSTFGLWPVHHELDNRNDLIWRFSNRHRLMDVPFGSEQHRQSIYSIFDPEGQLGLNSMRREPFGSDLQEGWLTRFLLEGVPPQRETFRNLPWTMHAPDTLSGSALALANHPGPMNNPLSRGFSPYEIFISMAQAHKYPAVDERLVDSARHGVVIMCTMIKANPDLVPSAARPAAMRAKAVGYGCFDSLVRGLNPDYAIEHEEVGLLPVSTQEVRREILGFMNSESLFREKPEGLLPSYGMSNPSTDFVSPLLAIATGQSVEDMGRKDQELAESILRKLVSPLPTDTPQERKRLERSRRDVRDWVGKGGIVFNMESEQHFNRHKFVHRLYCETGWGHADDSMELADQTISQAKYAVRAEVEGGKLSPVLQRNLDQLINLLVMMTKNIRSADPEEVKLESYLQNAMDEMRPSTVSPGGNEIYKRFLALYDARLKTGGKCQ